MRGLHKNNLPYIFIWVIYYAWVVIFSTGWMTPPLPETVFQVDLRTLLYSVSLLSSGVAVFIIRKEWFVKTARIGALLLLVEMVLYLTLQDNSAKLAVATAIAISLGFVNTSVLMPFVFTLNNTEKLYAVVGSNLLICAISLLQEDKSSGYLHNNHDLLPSFIIIVIALGGIIFFNKARIPENDEFNEIDRPEFHTRIYLTLFFNFIVFILCNGAGKGLLRLTAGNSEQPVLMWYYIGGVVGCFIYLAIYRYNSKPFIWLANITFSSFVMGIFCHALSERNPGMTVAFSVLLGIGSAVGMINMYYIIGVVGKKYNSMRYLRWAILVIGICGGIASVIIVNLVQRVNTFEISMIVSVISVAMMLLFIMLAPLISQSHYYDDWAKDSEKTEIDNEQLHLFKGYQLSKREIEVCKLLIQGYTMRQVSGILSIAYSTVNTYCTSIYRKLGINSRTELLVLFKDYTVK